MNGASGRPARRCSVAFVPRAPRQTIFKCDMYIEDNGEGDLREVHKFVITDKKGQTLNQATRRSVSRSLNARLMS